MWSGAPDVSFGGAAVLKGDGTVERMDLAAGSRVKVGTRTGFCQDVFRSPDGDGTGSCSVEFNDGCREVIDLKDVEVQGDPEFEGDTLDNMLCKGSKVRVLRAWSTTSTRSVTEGFTGPSGFLFKIHIPKGFWGARHIADISFHDEDETLFPPHSLFQVMDTDFSQRPALVEMRALDKHDDPEYNAKYWGVASA